MQRIFLALAVLIGSLAPLHAAGPKLDALQVGRYTRQGANVLVETGLLRAPTIGFVALNATTYLESSLGIPANVITAISGKALAYKATIDLYNQTIPGFLDNYTFSSETYPVVGGESYIVTLATGGGTNAPTASVGASKKSLTEGPKAKSSFVVTLDKAPTSDIALLFKFSGSAKSGDDFLSTNSLGSLKIKKGKKTGKVTVTLRDDKLKEPKEKLVFTLLSNAGYKIGKPKSATVTITDND